MKKHTFLADECVPHDIVVAFRQAGYTVYTARECELQGKPDKEIFAYALVHQLTLFTFDRGFGDIFQFSHIKSSGTIIVLIKAMSRDEMVQIPLAFFSVQSNLKGKLVIIGIQKIRIIER